MDSFASLLPWFLKYGYFALFVVMVAGGLYLPVPSNIALIGAGAFSHFSQNGIHLNIFLAAIIGLVGSIIGDVGAYYISRRFSSTEKRAKFEKRHKSLHKIELYLKKHPMATVSVTRLIGFLSPAVNTLAGFTKLSAKIFILGDILGNIIYVIIFMGAGYLVGNVNGNIDAILGFGIAILVVLAGIYIGAIILIRK